MPWATAGADRSRQARDQKRARKRDPASEGHSPSEANAPNVLTKSNTMRHNAASRKGGESPKKGDESPLELTQEEHLLAELLDANEALTGVLLMYDDIERIGIEREAEERSRREVRVDRSVGLWWFLRALVSRHSQMLSCILETRVRREGGIRASRAATKHGRLFVENALTLAFLVTVAHPNIPDASRTPILHPSSPPHTIPAFE